MGSNRVFRPLPQRAGLLNARNANVLKQERLKGIEPSSQAWEAGVLPLHHSRRIADGTALGMPQPNESPDLAKAYLEPTRQRSLWWRSDGWGWGYSRKRFLSPDAADFGVSAGEEVEFGDSEHRLWDLSAFFVRLQNIRIVSDSLERTFYPVDPIIARLPQPAEKLGDLSSS